MSSSNAISKKTGWSAKIIALTVILLLVALILVATLCCFVFINELPSFNYEVILPNGGNILLVSLEITNPLLSKTREVSLLIGDKQIDILACVNASGQPSGNPLLEDGVFYIRTGRGSKTYLTYSVEVSTSGKHGYRGQISSDYAMFDGEQALLLPADSYTYNPGKYKTVLMSEISFGFDMPDGWEQITPREPIKNPLWADIYAITQDAFVFGIFDELPVSSQGLKAYVLSGGAESASSDVLTGFDNLYAYYSELFGDTPENFTIVALPKPDDEIPQVIGGAGRSSVAASFDADSLRDWELMSHRLFHAFFDTAAPYPTFRMDTNTWFYEGLASYYENQSLDALPDSLKSRLNVDVNRQLALLFDRYLYMRIKEPTVYGFPPMREDSLTIEAQIEFLHYTVAPLLVKLLEDKAIEKGAQPNSALRYCVDNGASLDERFVSFEAAINLLGEDDAGTYIESYLLSIEVPPLWYLEPYQPSDEEVLAALNDIESILGSWFLVNDDTYYIDTVTYDQLQNAIENSASRLTSFVSTRTSVLLKNYCAPLYALLNDYYYRAKQKGLDFDDPELRRKMFYDEIYAGES